MGGAEVALAGDQIRPESPVRRRQGTPSYFFNIYLFFCTRSQLQHKGVIV